MFHELRQQRRGGQRQKVEASFDTKGNGVAMAAGDWACPGCGDHQFAKNASCRRCGTSKPVGMDGGGCNGGFLDANAIAAAAAGGGCGAFGACPGYENYMTGYGASTWGGVREYHRLHCPLESEGSSLTSPCLMNAWHRRVRSERCRKSSPPLLAIPLLCSERSVTPWARYRDESRARPRV